MLAPGASCGQTGDSLDRVCEDPPLVSDPGPGGTLGGSRQGRAGPAQPNKGGPQSRPDRGPRAHPRTPEWAWLPHTPEMLTLAGAGGAAPEAIASNGKDRPTAAQSSSLGGPVQQQNKGAQAPTLDRQLLLPIPEERGGARACSMCRPASRSLLV